MVYIKDTKDGMIKVLYNPKEVISNLPTPIIRDPKVFMSFTTKSI